MFDSDDTPPWERKKKSKTSDDLSGDIPPWERRQPQPAVSSNIVAGYRPLVGSSGNKQYDAWYDKYGKANNIDPNLLLAQGGQESSYNPRARSNAGAYGLAQFMPDTARELGVDPRDPESSINGQARLMRRLLDRTNDIDLSLAGYNSGHNASIPRLQRNARNILETRDYIAKIRKRYDAFGQSVPSQMPEMAADNESADDLIDPIADPAMANGGISSDPEISVAEPPSDVSIDELDTTDDVADTPPWEKQGSVPPSPTFAAPYKAPPVAGDAQKTISAGTDTAAKAAEDPLDTPPPSFTTTASPQTSPMSKLEQIGRAIAEGRKWEPTAPLNAAPPQQPTVVEDTLDTPPPPFTTTASQSKPSQPAADKFPSILSGENGQLVKVKDGVYRDVNGDDYNVTPFVKPDGSTQYDERPISPFTASLTLKDTKTQLTRQEATANGYIYTDPEGKRYLYDGKKIRSLTSPTTAPAVGAKQQVKGKATGKTASKPSRPEQQQKREVTDVAILPDIGEAGALPQPIAGQQNYGRTGVLRTDNGSSLKLVQNDPNYGVPPREGYVRFADENGQTYLLNTATNKLEDESLAQEAEAFPVKLISYDQRHSIPVADAKKIYIQQVASYLAQKYDLNEKVLVQYLTAKGVVDWDTKASSDDVFYESQDEYRQRTRDRQSDVMGAPGTTSVPQRAAATTITHHLTGRQLNDMIQAVRGQTASNEQRALSLMTRGILPPEPTQSMLDGLNVDLSSLLQNPGFHGAQERGEQAQKNIERVAGNLRSQGGYDDYSSQVEARAQLNLMSRASADAELDAYRRRTQELEKQFGSGVTAERIVDPLLVARTGITQPSPDAATRDERAAYWVKKSLEHDLNKYGTFGRYFAEQQQAVDDEKARVARMKKMPWGEYVENAARGAVFGTAKGLIGATGQFFEGFPIWTKPIADYIDATFGTRSNKITDNLMYRFGQEVQKFGQNIAYTNPDFDKSFLWGMIPQAVGSSLAFLPAAAAEGWGIIPFATVQMTGGNYDEALQDGAKESDAQTYARLSGAFLGWTEMLGFGSIWQRLLKGEFKNSWKQILLEAAKEGAEEVFTNEGPQDVGQNLLASLTFDPTRKWDQGIADQLGAAGVSAPLTSIIVSGLLHIKNRGRISRALQNDLLNGGSVVRDFGSGYGFYVFGKPIEETEDMKPLMEKHRKIKAELEQGIEDIKSINEKIRTSKDKNDRLKWARHRRDVFTELRTLVAEQQDVSAQIRDLSGVPAPGIVEQKEAAEQSGDAVQTTRTAAENAMPTSTAETTIEGQPSTVKPPIVTEPESVKEPAPENPQEFPQATAESGESLSPVTAEPAQVPIQETSQRFPQESPQATVEGNEQPTIAPPISTASSASVESEQEPAQVPTPASTKQRKPLTVRGIQITSPNAKAQIEQSSSQVTEQTQQQGEEEFTLPDFKGAIDKKAIDNLTPEQLDQAIDALKNVDLQGRTPRPTNPKIDVKASIEDAMPGDIYRDKKENKQAELEGQIKPPQGESNITPPSIQEGETSFDDDFDAVFNPVGRQSGTAGSQVGATQEGETSFDDDFDAVFNPAGQQSGVVSGRPQTTRTPTTQTGGAATRPLSSQASGKQTSKLSQADNTSLDKIDSILDSLPTQKSTITQKSSIRPDTELAKNADVDNADDAVYQQLSPVFAEIASRHRGATRREVLTHIRDLFQNRFSQEKLLALRPHLKRFFEGEDFTRAVTEQSEPQEKDKDQTEEKEKVEETQEDTDDIPLRIAEAFRDAFLDGHKFTSITEARKFAADIYGKEVQTGTIEAKQLDEGVELGVVLAARAITEKGQTETTTFDDLVRLYDQQPNLNVRTSTSVAEQAYSTPVPLAYAASVIAGINENTTVYEPTAGNGMLLIEADPSKTVANELNDDRADNLDRLGFDPTTENATEESALPADKVNVVIGNPPFGSIKDKNNRATVFHVAPNYDTTQIDHVITLNALKAMKNNGRAVFIIGGPNPQLSQENIIPKHYLSPQRRDFFVTLFRDYNVVDLFTVSGDMYRKQGAGYPVDVIVIDGTGKSAYPMPFAEAPRVYKAWDDLKEVFSDGYKARTGLKIGSVDTDDLGSGDVATSNSDKTDSGNGSIRGEDGRGQANEPVKRPSKTPRKSVRGRRGNRGGKGSSGNVGNRPDGGHDTRVDGDERPSNGVDDGANGDLGEWESDGSVIRGSRGNRGDDASGLGGRTDIADSRVKTKVNVEQIQAKYEPHSKGYSFNVLVPTNLKDATDAAMTELKSIVGDLNQYVQDRVGFDPDGPLSAEGTDAVAAAIYQIERGSGFILGDQTGLGKGRMLGTLIHYASKAGMTPIFVTERPELYKDIVRDLIGIGVAEFKDGKLHGYNPLVTNANLDLPLDADETVFLRTPATQNKVLADVLRRPEGLGEYNVIFTTYHQLQAIKGKQSERHHLLRVLASNALLILDESHKAGGQGGRVDMLDPKNTSRAAFVRQLADKAKGVVFSSATFAKNANVLDLYARTDLSLAVPDPSKLAQSVQRGGLPMQQVISRMLARGGQYIRRERDFTGISYTPTTVKVDRQIASKMSDLMKDIFDFSQHVKTFLPAIQTNLQSSGMQAVANQATGQRGAESIHFGSIMHNLISQMLLAGKSEPTAQMAIDALKEGKKPVITVSATLGEAIKRYADAFNLQDGDPIAASFGDMVKHYLIKTRELSLKGPLNQTIKHYISDQELGFEGAAFFKKILDKVNKTDWGSLPASPIDRILQNIREGGFTIDEITGREHTIDYSGDTPVYRIRRERNARHNTQTINHFQNGTLQSVLINRSAQSGISLHSDVNTPTAHQQRVMFVVQFEPDVDALMQLFGRINRTGQKTLPAYVPVIADIPAETRPAAIASQRMASLNASTSASVKNALTAHADMPDFLNLYGDEVMIEFMNLNPDIHRMLGEPLSKTREDAMRRVTGRIVLLPIDMQERVYKILTENYNAYITHLNETGNNTLTTKQVDLDAKTIESYVIAPRVGNSPFEDGISAELADVKRLIKPFKKREILEILNKSLDTDFTLDTDLATIQAAGKQQVEDLIKTAVKETEELLQTAPDTAETTVQRIKTEQQLWIQTMRALPVGTPIQVTSSFDTIDAVVLGLTEHKTSIDQHLPSIRDNWKVRVGFIGGGLRGSTFPFTRFGIEGIARSDAKALLKTTIIPLPPSTTVTVEGAEYPALDAFDNVSSSVREQRYLVTGNLFGGYVSVGDKGEILYYTTADSEIKQGILLPKKTNFVEMLNTTPVVFRDMEHIITFLQQAPDQRARVSDPNDAFWVTRNGLTFSFITHASKVKGGHIFLNTDLTNLAGQPFVKTNKLMVLRITNDLSKVKEVLEFARRRLHIMWQTQTMKPLAQEVTGQQLVAPPTLRSSIRPSVAANEARSAEVSPIGFYSRLEKTILDKMPEKASPEQVLGLLDPQKGSGIKGVDPEYQALKLWLDDQKGTITKNDVLDFVQANKVNVENVVLDNDAVDVAEWWNDEGGANEEVPWNELSDEEQAKAVDRYNEEVEPFREGAAQFSQHTLSGDRENYREEFLTAPSSAGIWKDGHSDYDSGVSELSAEERSRFLEGIKPNRLRETVKNFFGAKITANFPLKGVESSVIPVLHYDQVRRAIVAALPVDVVNVLSDNGISTEDVGGDFTVLEKQLPPDVFSRVSRAIRIASGEIGTLFGTRLSNSLSRGVDETLLPALRTSDLDSSAVFQTLSQLSRGDLGSGISRVESRSASSGTKNVTGSRDGLSTSLAGSDRLSNRGIPAGTPTEPPLRSGNGFIATEGTKTGAASGGFVTGGTAKLVSPSIFNLSAADLAGFVNTHKSILAQKRGEIINPIVRMRYDDRETTNGDDMLFVEEVQQPSPENLAQMPKVYQKYGEEMGWRRMVYKAINEGYDYLGFTTGEQQADRYNLAKVVSSIEVSAKKNGIQKVTIHPMTGELIDLAVKDGGTVTSENDEFNDKQLSEIVGKHIAKQILELTEPLTIEGEGLKVGGKDLASRYDKKAVDYLNKFLKPYDGKVETINIGTDADIGSLLDDQGREVWKGSRFDLDRQLKKDPNFTKDHTLVGFEQNVYSIKVTSAMKEAFKGEDKGVPLLSAQVDTDIDDEFTPAERLTIEEMRDMAETENFGDFLRPGVAQVEVINGNIKANAASQEIYRRTLEQIRIERGETKVGAKDADDIFVGAFQDPKEVAALRRVLQEKRAEAEAAGYPPEDLAVLDAHIQALDMSAAAHNGTAVIYTLDSRLPHEVFHRSDYLGSMRGLMERHTSQSAKALDAHEVTKKLVANHFRHLATYQGLKDDPQMRAAWIRSEIPPRLLELSDVELEKIGITPEMRADYLQLWFEGYAAKNGIDALDHFDQEELNVKQFIEQARTAFGDGDGSIGQKDEADIGKRQEIDSKERPDTGRGAPSAERARPTDAEGGRFGEPIISAFRHDDSASLSEVDGRDFKLRRLPLTMQAAGIAAIKEAYAVFHDTVALAEASRLFNDLGLAGSIDLVRNVSANEQDIQHSLLSFIIVRTLFRNADQVEILDPASAREMREQAQALISEHARRATQAGRFTRGPSIIGVTAETYTSAIERIYEKNFHRPFTYEALLYWRGIGTQIETLHAQQIKDAQTIQDLTEAIERAQAQVNGQVPITNVEAASKQEKAAALAKREQVVSAIQAKHGARIEAVRQGLIARFGDGRVNKQGITPPTQKSPVKAKTNKVVAIDLSAQAARDGFPLDDYIEVGAMFLTVGLASKDTYLPEHFRAEMIANFGDVVEPYLDVIHREALAKSDQWLKDLREEKQRQTIKAKYNKKNLELTDQDIDEILRETKARQTVRSTTKRIHEASAKKSKIDATVLEVIAERSIIPTDADEPTQINIELIANAAIALAQGKRADAVMQEIGQEQDTGKALRASDRREIMRQANALWTEAKVESQRRKTDVANDLLAMSNSKDSMEVLQFKRRQERQKVDQKTRQTLTRIRDGEASYYFHQALELSNVSRSIMASLDFSGALRQGGFFTIANPLAMKQAFKNMFAAVTQDNYARKILEIERHPLFTLMQQAGIDFAVAGREDSLDHIFSGGEEVFRGDDILSHIPIAGTITKISEQVYTTFLDTQRAQMFSIFAEDLMTQGFTFKENPEAFKHIAKFINVATGRGSIPQNRLGRLLMNLPLFAPRYTLSRFQLLNMTLNPFSYWRAPAGTRVLIAKQAARFYGVLGTALGIAAMFGLTSLDPDDPDFLKVKIGNTRLDLFAGELQPARLLIRATYTTVRWLIKGNRIPGESEFDMTNLVSRFVRSKLSPGVSLVWDRYTGSDFNGNTVSLGWAIGSRFMPLIIGDIWQAASIDGWRGVLQAAPGIFGVGTSTYKGVPERAVTAAEKLAVKAKAMQMDRFRPRSTEDREIENQVKELIARSRKGEDVSAETDALVAAGKIDEQSRKRILDAAHKTFLVDRAEKLSFNDFVAVFKVATPRERDELLPLLNKKMKDKDSKGELEPTLRQDLERLGAKIPGYVPMPSAVKAEFDKLSIPTPDVGESLVVRPGSGQKTTLNIEQYDKYRRQTLTRIYKMIDQKVASEDYKKLSSTAQKAILQKLINAARNIERSAMKHELIESEP